MAYEPALRADQQARERRHANLAHSVSFGDEAGLGASSSQHIGVMTVRLPDLPA